jgi:Ca2+-binding EF-hand superfamily protein
MASDAEAIRERFDTALSVFKDEYLEKTFREADADGSGCIDRDEFRTLCWKLEGSMTEDSIDKALADCDQDGNGEIDINEFKTWWASEGASQLRDKHRAAAGIKEWDEYEIQKRTYEKMNNMGEDRLKRTFASIDEDGSGLIEWVEFIRLMRRMAPALPDAEVKAIFGRIDADGSGEIDFEEFSEWWVSPEGKAVRGEDKREAEQRARLEELKLVVIEKAERREVERAQQEEADRLAREQQAAIDAEQEVAVTKLQATQRGRGARQQQQLEQQREEASARYIQSMARGKAARGQAARHSRAAVVKEQRSSLDEVRNMYWGEGEMAGHDARLRADYERLRASVPTSMTAFSFEQWRWRWLEMRSGGLLRQLEPALQREHKVRWLDSWTQAHGERGSSRAAVRAAKHARRPRPATSESRNPSGVAPGRGFSPDLLGYVVDPRPHSAPHDSPAGRASAAELDIYAAGLSANWPYMPAHAPAALAMTTSSLASFEPHPIALPPQWHSMANRRPVSGAPSILHTWAAAHDGVPATRSLPKVGVFKGPKVGAGSTGQHRRGRPPPKRLPSAHRSLASMSELLGNS